MTATPKTKTKLCWNCEGSVSVFDENCPYCAVYVGPAEASEDLHTPPYRLHDNNEDMEVPASPYSNTIIQDRDPPVPKENDGGMREVVMSAILLLSGSVFFIFSLVLFLFSNDGILTLQWNSAYWYLYLLLSIPMLIVGWFTLKKLEETSLSHQENKGD